MNPTDPVTTTSSSGLNRRSFLQSLGLGAGGALLPAILAGAPQKSKADLASDVAILNFALNFEYLEAEYYTRGTTGLGLADFGIPTDSNGTAGGTVIIKDSPKVTFDDPNIEGYANEVAEDERLHVQYVRDTITALGGIPIPRPSTDYLNSFNMVAMNAGIANSFDPFANQENFLLGGITFSDVTVTALKGAAGLLSLPTVKLGAAGLLGTEGYHAGILRYNILAQGADAIAKFQKISDLRDSLDGVSDKDQGVIFDGMPNITPVDANSIVFGRTPKKVKNIVYGARNATKGLFFPAGVNGVI